MKFVISSSVLSARLQSIGRVIAAKTTMPILNCFVFDIKSKRLELTAADNEITLRTISLRAMPTFALPSTPKPFKTRSKKYRNSLWKSLLTRAIWKLP